MTRDQAVLLGLAREAIDASFRGVDVPLPGDAWLKTPAAVFVTLRQWSDGALRGCIGSIEARLPLGEAVVAAARAAAFRDDRFAPLSRHELPDVRVEVSVLSAPVLLEVADEPDAHRQLARARPGVILRAGQQQGVLLPKVWDAVDDAAEFLLHLKLKAGLPAAYWSAAIELHVFTSDDCAETDDRSGHPEAP